MVPTVENSSSRQARSVPETAPRLSTRPLSSIRKPSRALALSRDFPIQIPRVADVPMTVDPASTCTAVLATTSIKARPPFKELSPYSEHSSCTESYGASAAFNAQSLSGCGNRSAQFMPAIVSTARRLPAFSPSGCNRVGGSINISCFSSLASRNRPMPSMTNPSRPIKAEATSSTESVSCGISHWPASRIPPLKGGLI